MKIVYDNLEEFALIVEKCTQNENCWDCVLSPLCKDNDKIQKCVIVKCGVIK